MKNYQQNKTQILQRNSSYTYNFADDGREDVEIFDDESGRVAD